MNLFFNLPYELQNYIYTFDTTFKKKYDIVLKQFENKFDVASACGYVFPKKSIDSLLQDIYHTIIWYEYNEKYTIQKHTIPQCDCYFCRVANEMIPYKI